MDSSTQPLNFNALPISITRRITSTSTTSTHTVDPSRGAPKLHVNALKEFDGQPINYEDWERGYKMTLEQTAYAPLIKTSPTTGETILETRD